MDDINSLLCEYLRGCPDRMPREDEKRRLKNLSFQRKVGLLPQPGVDVLYFEADSLRNEKGECLPFESLLIIHRQPECNYDLKSGEEINHNQALKPRIQIENNYPWGENSKKGL